MIDIREGYSLSQGFIYGKGLFILRVIALWLSLSIPLYILFYGILGVWDIFTTLAGFPIMTALIVAPELNTDPNAKLVITKPLLSRTATLHLKAPYQGFDRQTYQELFKKIKKIRLNCFVLNSLVATANS